MNVLVLMPYFYDTVPGQRFRIEQWARFLEPQGIHFHFVPFESDELRQVLHVQRHYVTKAKELLRCLVHRVRELSDIIQKRRWDVIFLYRELLPVGPPILERALSRRNIPIIYDFDDAIFLPDVSEANRRFQWLKWPQKTGEICRYSTHVTVGNQYLKEFVRRYTQRVSVIPTTIDTDSYTPKGHTEIRGLPVIGWSGSLTTLKHLRTIGPVLKALRKSIPFRFKVIGGKEFCIPGLEVECKPWSASTEIEDLKSFDIGLMPLPNDAWSLGKCGLKALQYMAVGVPAVASPVGINLEIIQNGRNGFIAANLSEWVEKLSLLISDGALRSRFSQEGRKTVEERYSAKVQAPKVLEILEQVQGLRPTRAKENVLSLKEKQVSASLPVTEATPIPKERQDILCFSSIDWDFVWQGHQEIMSTLARQGHRILFVENTGVRNPRLQDLSRIQKRLAKWRRSLQGFWQTKEENLYIFSPLVLPFPYARLALRINRWLLVSALKRWMRILEFDKPICWTFLPTPLTLEVIRSISLRALVYYCIDSFIDSTPAAGRIAHSEQTLLKQADLVFVTSEQLFQYAAQWNPQVHLFPFGVSFQLFEQARDAAGGPPEELKPLRRPIVGYVGGIHRWLDQELLSQTARSCRDCTFVLVGPEQTDVAHLRREPNIVLLGQKPHGQLPHYIKHFDVGIIPYRLTEYTRNVYPTKLNEYHAMGKPVISTPLQEILAFNRRYQDLVRIASTGQDFRYQIRNALGEDTRAVRELRIRSAQDNTWSHRIEAMQALIQKAVARKASHSSEDWAVRFSASLRVSRTLLSWMIGCALLIGIVFHTPLIWFLAKPLVVRSPAESADVIVVFAGGVGESGQADARYQERVKQAVELFQQGYAPRILFMSGYTWTFQEADIMRALAKALEVPETAILTEKRVRDTHDYVLRAREQALHYGWKSILLVTSHYHTRRATLTFVRNAPELKVIPIPVLESSYYDRGSGITPSQIRSILHEMIGIVVYWIKGWI